ncbi:MAG: GIY-YIG nuclease family protein [Candidatus Omnitrophota bacterium]|nr:GIY-YIG nuclease family protein [Candidatus Omnitrophota bacterium]
MHCVYILRNIEGRCYIGSSKDLERRLREHNCNFVSSTKNRGPFRLIHKEEFVTRSEARKRENQIKDFKGNSKFKKLIEGFDPVV